MTRNATLAALAALALLGAAPAPAATVDDILNQARAAMGGNAIDRLTAIERTGTVNFGGIPGKFEQWNTLGALAGYIDAGPFTGANGFDGAVAWSQDSSGLVWVDGGKAGHYSAIANAYLGGYDWLRPQRRGAASYLGRKTDAGVDFDVLELTPPGGLPLQLWLDAKTHLPARTIVTVGTQTNTSRLSDYRRVNGVMIAYRETTVSDTGNTFDTTTQTVIANPPDVAKHLVKPASHVVDASITSGDETTVPIELSDNHVYLSVMLNGKGPYRFIFDTGGANVVDTSVAQAIGATAAGSLQGGGVGNQSEGFSFTKLASLQIGNAKVADQYFAVVPIRQSFGVAGGKPADGLIGFEVLSRFITTFDYGNKKLTLRSFSAGAPHVQGADTIPFVFNDTIPQIACQLDGIAGDCSVDTGSRASLSVLTPYIAAHPSVVPADATEVGINGFGVGGPAMGRLGRLTSLQIGNTSLPGLIADFSVQTKGYFANPFIAANVGGGVWRRFTVIFNYADQTIGLAPNADFGQRDEYDRSGLFLIVQGGMPVVLSARPNTPGAQAGLARGDTITAINGKTTAGMSLQDVRDAFRQAAGTKFTLIVKSKDGTTRDVSLTLRDYV